MSDEDFLSCVLRESDGGIRLGIGSNNVSLVFLKWGYDDFGIL